MSTRSLLKYSNVAYSCLNEERVHRPNMDNIVDALEEAMESQLQYGNTEKKFEHLKIPLTHIQSATDDFSDTHRIAYFVDGYSFYRAELEHSDRENHSSKRHSTVIIKRYPPEHELFGEKEFFTEIEMLTSVKHPNIVTLLGFCLEASEMILVIDNFSNGFLGDYLGKVDKMRVLTWEKRLKICIDVAHALNYIHSKMENQKMIINRDIWSYNIGLDENYGAKVVNFGGSVFLPPNQEDQALYLKLIGRLCYIDPEYAETNKLKRESDVYGFGVVLFELLCGRLAYDPIYKKESDKGLAYVARRCFSEGTLKEMIDTTIMEETAESSFNLNIGPNKDSLDTFIELAYKCVAKTQDQRPTMKIVVKELEKALFFQVNGSASKKSRGFMVGKKKVKTRMTPLAKSC